MMGVGCAARAHCGARGIGAMASLVGLVQMTSTNDIEANLAACAASVAHAKAQGCALVLFPECFAMLGAKKGETQAAAEELDGPLLGRYRALAKEHGLWLSLGGFPERGPRWADDQHIFNTHVVVTAAGEISAVYRKIHLFDVPSLGLVESRQALPGDVGAEPYVVACDSPAARLGLR